MVEFRLSSNIKKATENESQLWMQERGTNTNADAKAEDTKHTTEYLDPLRAPLALKWTELLSHRIGHNALVEVFSRVDHTRGDTAHR
jgi:hypothetical protein